MPSQNNKPLMQEAYKALATALGAGLIPFAPGTFGTLMGALLVVIIKAVCPQIIQGLNLVLLAVFVTILGVVVCEECLRLKFFAEQDGDPQQIVIDEVAGLMITICTLPLAVGTLTMEMVAAGFVLFRLFDITKPGPVRQVENLPGGWGIMADDVLAGIFAALLLQAFVYSSPSTFGL